MAEYEKIVRKIQSKPSHRIRLAGCTNTGCLFIRGSEAYTVCRQSALSKIIILGVLMQEIYFLIIHSLH